MTTDRLLLPPPDDWHLHLRDGPALATTVAASARQFRRAIVMPNLLPPVTRTEQALAYRARILEQVPEGLPFEPLMTLYLTDRTDREELLRARDSGLVHAVKLYPAGATTNSDAGVSNMENIIPALEAMQELDIPLLVHGEVTDPDIDIFDRERVFIERHLAALVENFAGLRVVMEHITTADAVDFVQEAPARVAATITAHHLLYDRNAMLAGGIRPHFYCLPILKRGRHRQALIRAATSGDPKYFLGTDSAPHERSRKESDCGCAGCFTASHALELYAEAFERAGALDRLAYFASEAGADFYRLPRNQGQVELRKSPTTVPEHYPMADGRLVPLNAGETLNWTLQ